MGWQTKYKSTAPERCQQCQSNVYSINGLYCKTLKMYVEHINSPYCERNNE